MVRILTTLIRNDPPQVFLKKNIYSHPPEIDRDFITDVIRKVKTVIEKEVPCIKKVTYFSKSKVEKPCDSYEEFRFLLEPPKN